MLRVLVLYSGIGGMHCALLHARELRRLRLLGFLPSSLPSETPHTTPSEAKATAAASAATATAAATDAALGHGAAAATSNDAVSAAEGAAPPAASPPTDVAGEAELAAAAAAAFPVAPAAAAQAATGGGEGAAEAEIAAAEAHSGAAAEEVLPLTSQFLRELAEYALDGDSYCIHPLIAKHMKKLVMCAVGSRSYSTAAAAGYNAAPTLAATSDTAAATSTARDSAVSCPAASAVAGGARVSAPVPAACSACASASAAPASSAFAAVACPSAPAASVRTAGASSPAAAGASDDHFLSVAVVGAIDVNPTAMEVYRWNFVTSESASAAAFPSSTPASAVAAVPTGTSTCAGADAQHRLKRRQQQQQTRDQQEEEQASPSSEQQLRYQQKVQGAHKHLLASPIAAALRAGACTSAAARLGAPATQAAPASTAAAAAAGSRPAEEVRAAEGGGGAGSRGCALPEEARGGSSAAAKLQSGKTMSPAGSEVVMIEGRRAAAVADDSQGAAVASGERQSGRTAASYESSPGKLKKDEAWKTSPTKREGGDGAAAEAAQERTPAGLVAALKHRGETGKREGEERGTGSRGLYSSSSSRISKSRTDTTTNGSPYLSTRSISSFSAVEWCHFAADLWLVSPPCQPFTRSGFRRGNADARTSSLLQLFGTLCEMEKDLQPKYLLLENVVGFESSDTFASLLHALRCRCCYDVKVFHLNPLHFGIPNCRSRCFVTAVKRRNGTAVSAALQARDEGSAEKERGIAEALRAAGRPGSAAPLAEAPEAAAGESAAAAEEEEDEEKKRATSATVQEEAALAEGAVAADTRTAASAVPDDEAAEQKAQEAAAAARKEAFAGGIGDVAERDITAPAREMTHAASLGAPAHTTAAIQDEDETNFEASAGTHSESDAARDGRQSSCCNTSSVTGALVHAPASLSACRQQKRSALSHKSRAAAAAVSGDTQGATRAARGAAAGTGTEEEKGSSSSSTELFPLWDEDCVRCRRTLAAGVEVLPFIPGLYQQPLFFCCPIRPVDHFLEEDIPPKRNRCPSSATASSTAPPSAAAAPSARPAATGSSAAGPAAGIHAAAASSLTAPAAIATSLPTAAASATAAASPVAAVCAASAHAADPCPGAPTAAAVPSAAPEAADFSLSAGTVTEAGGEAAGRITATSHGPAAAEANCAGVAALGSPVSVDVDAAGDRQLFERRAHCAISAAKTSGGQGEREEAGTPEAESGSGSENVEREPSLSMEHKKSIWCQVDLVRKTDKRSCCFTRSYGRSGRAQYGSLLLLNDDLQLEERWTAFAEKQQRQQTVVSQEQQQHQEEKQERQREQGKGKEQQQRYTEGKQEQQEAEERQRCHQAQQEQRPTHERQRSEQHWLRQEDETYRLHMEKQQQQQQQRAEHSRRPRKGWELHDVLAPGDVDVRFFSVREMLSLHGFPAVFAFPPRPANASPTKDFVAGPSAPPVSWTQQQRRLVGNSLNVYVVAMLIDYLIDDADWH